MKFCVVVRSALTAFLGGSLFLGCHNTPPERHADLSQEPSVKPGINAEYLKPDLDPSRWVERFEKEGREVYDQRHQIVAAAKIQTGAQVADIGSGTGLFTPLLASAAGPTGKVYAVDIVPAFLELVEKKAKEAGMKNIETVLCTERSVNLPPNSIDQAFICDVYHHFEFPKQSLASLYRALRPGGEVLLVDFKREPGQSSEWALNHIRAGQAEVTREFEEAGFEKVEGFDFLKENYVLRFRKK